LQESQLQQVGLDDVFDRVGLLTHRRRERREPDGPAAEPLHDRLQDRVVEPIEAFVVDLEDLEARARDLAGDRAVVPHLGEVAHPTEQPVRDARGSPRPPRDLGRTLLVEPHVEDAGGTAHDAREVVDRVVVEPW
jgi:hypothetical protein